VENEICNRCGRTLKDAKSKERGYGPKCWKKQQHEEQEADNQRIWEGLSSEAKGEFYG